MIVTLLNKKFKISDLTDYANTSQQKIDDWQTFYTLFKKIDPDSFKNGRMNYGWIQKMICELSNGLFTNGGQGRGRPDFWYNKKWGETKAYQLGNMTDVDVAASSFFARNSKVTEHNKLLLESKDKARKFLFEHSYDKNDYYLLTSTRLLKCEFSEIEMIFVEKNVIVNCLTESSNFKKVSMTRLLKRISYV
jgi:hypothetical protein